MRFRGSADAQGFEARDGGRADRRSLHADGCRSRGALPTLRRSRRRLEGFFWHHQDDRRQLENSGSTIGEFMRIARIAAAVCIAAVAATSMAASKLSGADAARIMQERHE